MTPRKEYTTYNFDPYNEAIDNQLETQRELIAEARSRKRLLNSKWSFYIISCICIIASTVAIIYWLLTDRKTGDFSSSLNANASEATSDLKLIAENSEEKYGIDTSYTVFNKTVMATGEIIVTAKEYGPDSLDNPDYQYCYLDSSAGTKKTITQLAFFEESGMELVTTNQRLIRDSIPLCQFQNPIK
jgi:hypothetical protein